MGLYIFWGNPVFAQKTKAYISGDIFQTKYFIENHGQFNQFNDGNQPVKFGVQNNGDHIYFNPGGYVWHLRKLVEKEEEINKKEIEIEDKNTLVEDKISMQWIGANPNCMIESEEKSMHYFTYGEAELSSYGYKKIIYKNLYPNIDVSYIIADKGGIKYSLVLNPGADLGQVKFTYSGKKIKLNLHTDTLFIKNPISDLIEYGLKVYDSDGLPITCNYTLKNNTVGFSIPTAYHTHKKIIIDPFVTDITTLTSNGKGNNMGYDVDYDYNGNLFVYGGGAVPKQNATEALKIAKYNQYGTLLWTFAGSVNSIPWNSYDEWGYASNFLVDKASEKVYIGQGFNSAGVKLVRLTASGTYDAFVSSGNPKFQEIWEMQFNCQSGVIYGMGGGTSSNLNFGVVNTTDGSVSLTNFTGNAATSQDIVSSAIDNSANVFVLMVQPSIASLTNHIFKLNNTYDGYTWSVFAGFNPFSELSNKPYMSASNGSNALYANGSYLYYYDGFRIKAFDKITGAAVGVYDSIPTHTPLYQSGIFADECNNIYLGGKNGNLKVYNFDGATFTQKSDIVFSGMQGRRVHDVKYNPKNNLLYVCGDSMVAVVAPSIFCEDSSLLISLSPVCGTNIIVYVTNPDPSALYTYTWTDTTAGTIIKTVSNSTLASDTLSARTSGHVYQIDVSKNALCGGTSKRIEFLTPLLYSTVDTTIYCNIYEFNDNVYSANGSYYDTLISDIGCDSVVTTNLTILTTITTARNITKCKGDSFYCGGQYQYTPGTYIDTLRSYRNCDSIVRTKLKINNPPKADFDYPAKDYYIMDSVLLNNLSTDANKWDWSYGTIPVEKSNLENPVYVYIKSGTFYISLLVKNTTTGCIDTVSKPITVSEGIDILIPSAFTPNDDEVNEFFFPITAVYNEMTMNIYNRWGELIYETSYNPIEVLYNTQNKGIGWDGNFKGSPCPTGVYLYTIKVRNLKLKKQKVLNGTFNLLR